MARRMMSQCGNDSGKPPGKEPGEPTAADSPDENAVDEDERT